jgi:hypothetical protein
MPTGVKTSQNDPRLKSILDGIKGRRDATAETLKKIIRAQYENKEIPSGAGTLTKQWHPAEGKNLLFILISDVDWQKHKNDPGGFKVEVTLHKHEDLNALFQGEAPFRVPVQQFEDQLPVEGRSGVPKIRWAVVDPTRSSATLLNLDPKTHEQMQKLLETVNAVNNGTQIPAARRSLVWLELGLVGLVCLALGVASTWFLWPRLARAKRR